jgi:hypothetical protein
VSDFPVQYAGGSDCNRVARFRGSSYLGQFEKPVLIEALVSQSTDEAVDKGVLDGFPWRDES